MSFVVVDLQNVISGHLKHLKTKTPSNKKGRNFKSLKLSGLHEDHNGAAPNKQEPALDIMLHFIPFLRDGAGPSLQKAQLRTNQSLLIQALMWFPRKSRYQCSPETVVSSSKTKVNCAYT